VNRRIVRKIMASDRARNYGCDRARGSAKLRRGRRAILRRHMALRDHRHLSIDKRLDLLERDLGRIERRR
jgi:hypothetical protein